MKTATSCDYADLFVILKKTDVTTIENNFLLKEQSTLNPIIKALKGEDKETQF